MEHHESLDHTVSYARIGIIAMTLRYNVMFGILSKYAAILSPSFRLRLTRKIIAAKRCKIPKNKETFSMFMT